MKLVGRSLLIAAAAAAFVVPGAADGSHDASSPHTRPEIVDAPVFIKTFAGPGAAPGQLSDPWHVALLPSGDLIVADTGNDRIQIFTRFGRILSGFGSAGTGPGEFSGPRGVAVDAEGNIIVADTGNHRIQVFDGHGGFVRLFGAAGSAAGEFSSPGGVDLTPEGNIVVADSGNHRVQILTSDGSPMREFGEMGTGDGQLDTPIDVAVDHAGRIFVAEHQGGRISLFDAAGAFISHISSPGGGEDELMEPSAVFLDDHELLHVLDTGNERVQGFVGNDDYRLGEYRWSFAEPVGANAPRGLVVDERGRTLVSDGAADHIEIWRYLKCMGWRGTEVGTEGDDRLSDHDPQGDFYSFVIIGRGGNDELLGDVSGDTFCGGAGDDRIFGAFGSDQIRGDAGNDYIEGGALGDTIRGNRGDDHILGLGGGDLIYGNDGADTIEAGDGPDRVRAGPGRDFVNGGAGSDRVIGGPDHDVCDGGDRGAPGDVLILCEEIVESPAPEGWYRIGTFAFRGSGAIFKDDFDLDPQTGYIWGANDTKRQVVARDHAGQVVAEHLVGGRPTHVQAHNGEVFFLDSTVDRVFVISADGERQRDWPVANVCDLEVTGDHVLATDGSSTVMAFSHSGVLDFEIPLEIESACTLSAYRDRIFVRTHEEPLYQVAIFDYHGRQVGVTAQQAERIRAIDVDRDGIVWVAGSDIGGFIRAYDQEGPLLDHIQGFEESGPSISGLVVDRGAAWTAFGFDFQHGLSFRIDAFTNLSCDGKSLTHVGTSYPDNFVTTSGVDVVHMGDGADVIATSSGDDVICGGRGADAISGGGGDDLLLGGNGDDVLDGGTGEDTCRGGNGEDTAVNCGVALGLKSVAVRFRLLAPSWPSGG